MKMSPLAPVFEAGDPAQMGGYTYAADNPATLSDPSGLYIPVESGSDCSDNSCTIQYKQDNGEGFNYSDAISYDNNQGSWSDLAGGAVNKLYDAAKPVIAAVLPGADGMLPDRIPLGNPNTTSYGAGGFYVNLALLGIPGGDEADVADIGLGVVADDTGKTVQTLYRADTRSTADIFSGGFKTKGDNMDIVQHVKMNSPDSGFVATSNSLTSAQNFAAEIRADYIYKLTGNGIDVNALFGDDSPFPWENEIAVPGGVGAGSIEGAWGPDGWISNPGYAP